MTYRELQDLTRAAIEAASEDARRSFAKESLRVMRADSEAAAERGLTTEELRLLDELSTHLCDASPRRLAQSLKRLLDSTSEDEVRAIEIDGDLIDYLCAVDHWIRYRLTKSPAELFKLEMNRMSSVDTRVMNGPVPQGYPQDMLAAPEVRDEVDRMLRLLNHGRRAED